MDNLRGLRVAVVLAIKTKDLRIGLVSLVAETVALEAEQHGRWKSSPTHPQRTLARLVEEMKAQRQAVRP